MNRLSLFIFALILPFLASCATAPPAVKEPTVFYPGPPDPPRIQFLRSFSGSDDLVPPKSAFASFVTGGRDKILILDKPYGIAGYQGKIYVCDTNNTVIVIDLEKKTFAPMAGVHGQGKLVQPLNISIDKDGNKYVADPLRGQVVMFDKNDFYVKAFGPVEGWKPVDAAAFEGLLYVVDEKNSEIKIFDIQAGALRNTIGKKGRGRAKVTTGSADEPCIRPGRISLRVRHGQVPDRETRPGRAQQGRHRLARQGAGRLRAAEGHRAGPAEQALCC